MSILQQLCQQLYDTPLATTIRESDVTFPVLESAHVLGLALMAGTIALVDFRLLGVVFRRESASTIARQLLPATWWGFGLMVVTGGLLFAAEAARLYGNIAFRVKIVLLLAAATNMLVFHFGTYRKIANWDQQVPPPPSARLSAILSLIFWAGVIVAGRLIAYFH